MADYPSKRKYDAANTQVVTLKLNKNTDADILEYLNASNNKQGTIKTALRRMIEQEQNMEKNLKWCVIDERGMDNFMDAYDVKEDAIEAAEREWNKFTAHDKAERDAFYVGLCNVEIIEGTWEFKEMANGCIDADVYEIALKLK